MRVPRHFQTTHGGQADVQQHEIVRFARHDFQCLRAIADFAALPAFGLKNRVRKLAYARVVIDQQNRCTRGGVLICGGLMGPNRPLDCARALGIIGTEWKT